MDLTQLAGSPEPITLGGRTYLLSPLTLGDLGTVRAWVREHTPDPFKAVAEALRALRPGLPEPQPLALPKPEADMTPAERGAWDRARTDYEAARKHYDALWAEYQDARQFLLTKAMEQKQADSVDGAAALSQLAGPEGMAFLLWLSLKKQHPEFDAPQKVQTLLDGESLDAVRRRLDAVNGGELQDAEEPARPLPEAPLERQAAA